MNTAVDASDAVLLTVEEAAEEVGVTAATIHVWVHRKYLEPAEKQGRRHLFRLTDVFKAEQTRDRKRRKRPIAC